MSLKLECQFSLSWGSLRKIVIAYNILTELNKMINDDGDIEKGL